MFNHTSSDRVLSLLSLPLILASLIAFTLSSAQFAHAGSPSGCNGNCSCYGGGTTYCHAFCGSACTSCDPGTFCGTGNDNP